ncbi:hypothetical protein VKT23_002791 [Stygiomarasmius scandens]|uniref:N-acetyltransferase domain-containing protein n=1 Tax=Marasmiellus scandens TaxID=2682957 RepID=A0ABR1JY24_9AGAR
MRRTARPPTTRYTVKNMNPLPKGSFSIRIREREHTIGATIELGQRFIIPADADIVFYPGEPQDDCDDKGIKIGHISASIILSDLICNTGYSQEFQIICDEHSHDLAKMAAELFDDLGSHRDRNWEEADQGDTLFILEVYLESKWRGYGLGLLSVRGLIDALPSFEMDSVIIDPIPMTRCNTEPGCFPTTRSWDRAISSLKRHWGLLGFQEASKKRDVHYLELWTGYVKPSIKEIVPHLFQF